jgi:UDP:flavonoid glycosyltransferase YjiC (YdhE family)
LPFDSGRVNRLTHHLVRQVMWQGFRSADKAARQEVLGLPPAPFWGPYNSPHIQGLPVLLGYSSAVIPRPPDWPENNHVTGYWFLDEATDWTPPAGLMAFLEAGPPPVYIGFGSMSSRNPEETAALVLEALKQSEQRAILLSGWGGLQASDVPDSVFMIDAIPHAWLFPRMAAVVHHGGAGTTAAGLRAGVPSIIIPFFGDQPFWGQRVAELGVGPESIPRKKLTAERLAQAIQIAVSNQAMRQRAAELGERIQAEDGVGRAVDIVGSLA